MYRSVALVSLVALSVGACDRTSVAAADAATGAQPASHVPLGTAHLGAPMRRSGWWEFSARTAAGAAMGKQQLCVSMASEARFSAFDQITQEQLIGYQCARKDFHQVGNTWSFDVVCDTGTPASLGGGVVSSQGTITGDMQTEYEIRMAIKQAGETRNGAVKAAWKGACPAGRKPGDLVIDGSDTVNVLSD